MSGTCDGNSRANFRSSIKCYTPFNGMVNTYPKLQHSWLTTSNKIIKDKLRKKVDNYGVMETTLEWEMED